MGGVDVPIVPALLNIVAMLLGGPWAVESPNCSYSYPSVRLRESWGQQSRSQSALLVFHPAAVESQLVKLQHFQVRIFPVIWLPPKLYLFKIIVGDKGEDA
jgi:hypothetical protein